MLAGYGGRVRLLEQANSGDLVARNHGLRAARSPLVAFCDSDDLWRPDFLAAMERLFLAAPLLIAAYGNFRLLQQGRLAASTKFDDAPAGFWDGLRAVSQEAGVFDRSVVSRLVAFQPFFTSAMAVNRAAFLELGGWDEGVSRIIGCDFATALRVGNAPPVGILHTPLVSIRKHGTNISGDTARMNLGDALVLEHVLATRPELAALRPEIERSIDRRRMEALETCYGRGDFAQVAAIDRLIRPAAKSLRLRAKTMIAGLPPPLAHLAARALDRRRR
jgi:glycosyltransferase involved in cell wall biosynthesis